MGNEENRTTELALGEMQLIRPTSQFIFGNRKLGCDKIR